MIRTAYYRYLNAHGEGTTSTVFLIVGAYLAYHGLAHLLIYILVVAILDAGRNALSFFLLFVFFGLGF